MMPHLYFGILILSAWIAMRSIGGLIDDQSSDAPKAARNRVERERGIRLADALSNQADLLGTKALEKEESASTESMSVDSELATIENQIMEIEAEYEPMLQRETQREQRVRSVVYGTDVALALAGIIGILIAIGGFISLAF